jgi:hypothetical protein
MPIIDKLVNKKAPKLRTESHRSPSLVVEGEFSRNRARRWRYPPTPAS